jgi:hypothetical protein
LLDYPAHRLFIDQIIVYVNNTGSALNELILLVEPLRYERVFDLQALSWASGEAIENYTFNETILQIPLQETLEPDASIEILMSYILDLPSQQSYFGYTGRQINLADWYPFIPPYTPGEGWLVSEPGLVGEHLAYDVADYEVLIRTPDLNIVLAAPAIGEPWDTGYFYRLEAARSFIWSASPEYVKLGSAVGETTLLAFILPEHRIAGEAAMQSTAQALSLYEDLFGAYPRPSLTLVEADFYDGLEADGLFFLDQEYFNLYFDPPRTYLTALAAHETAHQWWYSQVGNDPALEPWLDEALATYCELLFYERIYPEAVDWWWQVRVERLTPIGWVNSSIYDYTEFDPYVAAVYLRGVTFLQELRELIGDDAFFTFLREYAAQGKYRIMTSRDFFAILADHSQADISQLRAEYFIAKE